MVHWCYDETGFHAGNAPGTALLAGEFCQEDVFSYVNHEKFAETKMSCFSVQYAVDAFFL